MLQESSINTLLRKGADRNKLVLGVPLFGQMFKLKNIEVGVGFLKLTEGAGLPGLYVQEAFSGGYNKVSFCSCDGISRSRERISVRQ